MKTFKKAFFALLGFLGTAWNLYSIDFSGFTSLYTQNQDGEDPLLRFQKLESLRSEAQNSLKRLMARGPNVELEMRYAELLLQRGRDLEQFAIELSIANRLKESSSMSRAALGYFKEGLKRHTLLLSKLKSHPMAPKIYLGMGRTELGLNKKTVALEDADRGLKALHLLPSSKIAELKNVELQLWILRGDAAFELSNVNLSLESYTRAETLSSEASLERSYIFYRLAWVYYNRKDPEKALEELDQLFLSTKDKLALKQEAIQDYALFSADLSVEEYNKRRGVGGLFEKLSSISDSKSIVRAIERMGKTFAKNGRRAEAVRCFEYIIDQDPKNSSNVDRALTIVEWTHSLADKEKLNKKYLWLLTNFGPKSLWYASQKLNPDVQKLAYDKVESSLRKYAVSLHQEAMKIQDQELKSKTEDVVAQLYDEHLSSFGEAPRIHFYRAEIYRHKKDWAQSGTHYDSYIHNLDLNAKTEWETIDKKLRDEAAWSSVQVWAKAAELNSKYAGSFLTSADKFLKDYPKHPEASEVALDAAKVELKSSSSALALKRLKNLVRDYPQSKAAVEAVHAGLDVLNKESDFVNLALEARAWLESIDRWVPPSEKTKLSLDLKRILGQTEAKACEVLGKQEERQIEAALCYQSFAKSFSKDALAPKALLLSAEIFDKQKDSTAALESLERLVKEYPNSEYSELGMSRLASTYERSFQFEKAADIYEGLLSGTSKLADKDKILLRYLDLLQNLGWETKLNAWLLSKSTSESIRRDFESRRVAHIFEILFQEEKKLGYDEKGFRSSQAQKLFSEVEFLRTKRSFTLSQEIEYRRIKGALWRARKQLDKADEEWMAGLKFFWKSKDKNSEAWQSAARLRLEEGSVWEIVYKNTDLQKHPTRKVELFQKLESWYVEILSMKSPVVALDALWASSLLYESLAEEMKKSPETLPKAAEFHKKSIEIAQQIARKAREWRVLSPVTMLALQTLRKERDPTQIQAGDSSLSVRFPWAEIPRWMQLSAEQKKWEEWNWTSRSLQKVYEKSLAKIRNRSEARRAAFVALARDNSLKNKALEAWSMAFNDQAGIQLRIQAMIQDGDLSRAQLFENQYENFFGSDSFAMFATGSIEWTRGNYIEAYSRWMNSNFSKDFRMAYLQAGWNSVFEELSEGTLSSSFRKQIFTSLFASAHEEWQIQSLISLCSQEIADCQKKWTSFQILEELKKPLEAEQSWDVFDQKSAWNIRRVALSSFIENRIKNMKDESEISSIKEVLEEYYQLRSHTDFRSRELTDNYRALKEKMEHKQDQINFENKRRAVASGAQS